MDIQPCQCSLDPEKGGICNVTGNQMAPRQYELCKTRPDYRLDKLLKSQAFIKEYPHIANQLVQNPAYADVINRTLGKGTVETDLVKREAWKSRIAPCNYLGETEKPEAYAGCGCKVHRCNLFEKQTLRFKRHPDYTSCLDCGSYIAGRRINIKMDRILAPGDTVGIVAALTHIGKRMNGKVAFRLDNVVAPELADNNPFFDQDIDPEKKGVEEYTINQHQIHNSNDRNIHLSDAWLMSISSELGIPYEPIDFSPSIYLSKREVETRLVDGPYVVINASHKRDNTTKQWPPEYWQEVVDYLIAIGIKVVRVGEINDPWHVHHELTGPIDMVGQTGPPLRESEDYRPLISLVYHSLGTISHLSYLMHLGAQVPTKDGRLRHVLAFNGGREPVSWSQYPGSHLFHTLGSLPCCKEKPCWIGRVEKIDDGEGGHNHSLCKDPAKMISGTWANCQQLIKPGEVIHVINRLLRE